MAVCHLLMFQLLLIWPIDHSVTWMFKYLKNKPGGTSSTLQAVSFGKLLDSRLVQAQKVVFLG